MCATRAFSRTRTAGVAATATQPSERGWLDGRLQPYLAPTDRDQILALVDPQSPSYVLTDRDFFLSRTWLLATGQVPA